MIIIRGMGSTGRMLRRRKSIMYSCNGWINPLYPWMKIHGPIEARDSMVLLCCTLLCIHGCLAAAPLKCVTHLLSNIQLFALHGRTAVVPLK